MKVLFVSRYVDPFDARANQPIINQAKALINTFKVEVDILTWPYKDLWSGKIPIEKPTAQPLPISLSGLKYNVINCPLEWNESANGDTIDDLSWKHAIAYGVEILKSLNPDILHLHHRTGLWWILESAQMLSIPTIYTNYDFGIGCLRTTLLTGTGKLCDGKISPKICAECITKGRSSLFGKINEWLVKFWLGGNVIYFISKIPFLKYQIISKNLVKSPALMRTSRHQARLKRVMKKLDFLITPSNFGSIFFERLGVNRQNILIQPWFHEKLRINSNKIFDPHYFTLTYVGRVSPEKGVHLVFEALKHLEHLPSLKFKIIGADESKYCLDLKNRYKESVGHHIVEWHSWSPIHNAMVTTDVTIIPSTIMDNTPLALIESILYKTPVIATSIPTIVDYLVDGESGYLADFNSAKSFAEQIEKAFTNKNAIRSGHINFPIISTCDEYCKNILNIYKLVLKKKGVC